MSPRRLLRRLAEGAFANVAFADFVGVAQAVGFRLDRINGSHHVFVHPDVDELLNVQNVRGQAKPYQLRQFMGLVERYNLRLEDES